MLAPHNENGIKNTTDENGGGYMTDVLPRQMGEGTLSSRFLSLEGLKTITDQTTEIPSFPMWLCAEN
jgi:hypothetical protein